MKKVLFFAAAAVAMLTGCSQNDDLTAPTVAQNAQQTPVEFGTYLGRTATTRSTGGSTGDITTATLQTPGFGVIAYSTGATAWSSWKNVDTHIPNFMYNQHVTWNTNHWTYTPVKFWPNDFSNSDVDNSQGTDEGSDAQGSLSGGGKVSFFAYAPWVDVLSYSTPSTTTKYKDIANSAIEVSDGGGTPAAVTDGIVALSSNQYKDEPKVKYVLSNASLTNAVDLLWGIRAKNTEYKLADGTTDTQAASSDIYNTDLTKQQADEKITFLFKHALAKFGGHTYEAPNAQTGLQVILDLDNGSLDGGTTNGSAITDGTKEAKTLVTVNSITIQDLATATSGVTASNLVTTGWFNLATGTWDEISSTVPAATYSHVVNNSSTGDFAMNTQIKEPATTSAITCNGTSWTSDGSTTITGVTTSAQDVYTNTSNAPGIVLIPASTNQTLRVTITYTVRTYDTNLSSSANDDGATGGTWTKVTQTITNDVVIPGNSLASNKFYKLLIHLGLTSVKFSATVDTWDEAANSNDNDNTDSNKLIWLPSNTVTPAP